MSGLTLSTETEYIATWVVVFSPSVPRRLRCIAVALQLLQLPVEAELLRHVELWTLECRFKEPDLRVDDPQVVVHEQREQQQQTDHHRSHFLENSPVSASVVPRRGARSA